MVKRTQPQPQPKPLKGPKPRSPYPAHPKFHHNIKEEQKAKLDLDNSDRKKDVPNKVAKHKQPTPKKKKSKERG